MQDVQLIRDFRNGDTIAFNKLVSRWQNKIHRFVYRYFADNDEAREITQKTFIKVYHRIDTLDDESKFSSWIYRIATNLCLDEMNQTEKENFEQVLSESPDLQKELKEMQKTRNLLGQLTSDKPDEQPMFLHPGSNRFKNRWADVRTVLIPDTFSGRAFLAAAAVLLVSFLLASLVNLTISTAGDEITISFGSIPQAEQSGFSDEEVALLIEQVQRENAILATRLIEEAQMRQTQQFEEVMTNVISYFEEQRLKDLRLVDNGIARLEEETYNRFRQTDEALVDLIYAINFQQE